jgi:hypothetical protein
VVYFADFYELRQVLITGRITSGKDGNIIQGRPQSVANGAQCRAKVGGTT